MTNPNPNGQVPEALTYERDRAIMEGERNASLDAYSRVVLLTSAESRLYEAAFTNGWDRCATHVQNPAENEHVAGNVLKNGAEVNMNVYAELPEPDATTVGLGAVWNRHSMRDFADATHALRTQQTAPATQQAAGNSGFDHKTAADFLSGKTVSDEALRKFVAASRGAHDDRAVLRAQMLALRGVLASREAEIALLKRSLLDAEAAAPQPSQAATAESALEDAARLDFLIEQRAYVVSDPDTCPGYWLHFVHKETGKCWVQADEHPTPRAAIDAARKQGANHD